MPVALELRSKEVMTGSRCSDVVFSSQAFRWARRSS